MGIEQAGAIRGFLNGTHGFPISALACMALRTPRAAFLAGQIPVRGIFFADGVVPFSRISMSCSPGRRLNRVRETMRRVGARPGARHVILPGMAYEAHASCDTPTDLTVIWRYMDALKFMSMLENRSLWFSRADLVDDPREGEFTHAERHHLKGLGDTDAERLISLFQETRRQSFVSCWHASGIESMAMWKLYG